MLELALRSTGGPVQIGDIARNQKIPIRFLEQLLLILKRNGLVVSVRGKQGGYNLVKHPGDIKLLEIIEALEGEIVLATAKMKKSQPLFEVFQKVEEGLKQELKEISIEDLVFKKKQKERTYIYNI